MQFAGKRMNATVLFTDIRNFSKIVNILSLEETHSFLNDCFAPIVDTVLGYEGMVDKFIGDAVMAVFGVRTSNNDDSLRAVKCALDIQKKTDKINIKWQKSLDFLVQINIGISTGEVIAGNVGHIKRFDYTVIGRNVNLAAQIVHMCENYSVDILCDQRTYEETKENLEFKEIGEKIVLGYTEPVRLYSPIT